MAKTRQSRSGLSGPEGLVTGVIQQALKDALGAEGENRADAWRYFASDAYERHTESLGLPSRELPTRLKEMTGG